ncbi:hypothetical protein JTB14_000174 [Gonioctena quinquepunctata]|nr:hypothetical protein JTB14_000174 [Gonioctena quinquepunctata]
MKIHDNFSERKRSTSPEVGTFFHVLVCFAALYLIHFDRWASWYRILSDLIKKQLIKNTYFDFIELSKSLLYLCYDEMNALIDSVTTDDDTGNENEGDFDSDDDVADPDYLCEEDELAIDHCLNSNGMINESLNLSSYCNLDDVDDSHEPAPSP